MRSAIVNFILILFMISSAACKKDNHCEPKPATVPVTPPPTPAAVTVEIQMINTTFSPAEKTITKGTTVRWVNKDSYAHTVTANDNSFDSGNMNAGATFEHKFETAGTFDYKCQYHLPGMTGRIIVQ
jgi:plastocyanin